LGQVEDEVLDPLEGRGCCGAPVKEQSGAAAGDQEQHHQVPLHLLEQRAAEINPSVLLNFARYFDLGFVINLGYSTHLRDHKISHAEVYFKHKTK
jgi:hypothetical protein